MRELIRYLAAAATMLISSAAVAAEPKMPLDFLAYCQKHRNTETVGESSLYPGTQYPSAWRCMNGSVYVCELGATGRGCLKAGFSFAPAESVRNWCQENPNHHFVPGAYLPSAAISWKCRGKQPVIVGTSGLDEQGYVEHAWEKIVPILVPERSFASSPRLKMDPADFDALLKNLEPPRP